MNEYGYVKVGASTVELKVANTIYNVEMIKKQIDKNIQIISFPELSITGYTCGDLFNQDVLIDASYEGIKDLVNYSKDKMIVIIVGAPIKCENKLYNCAVVINDGKVLVGGKCKCDSTNGYVDDGNGNCILDAINP